MAYDILTEINTMRADTIGYSNLLTNEAALSSIGLLDASYPAYLWSSTL